MSKVEFKITEGEIACGVTHEAIKALRPKILIRDGKVFFPNCTPPALASATARYALGKPVEFAGFALDMPVYKAIA